MKFIWEERGGGGGGRKKEIGRRKGRIMHSP